MTTHYFTFLKNLTVAEDGLEKIHAPNVLSSESTALNNTNPLQKRSERLNGTENQAVNIQVDALVIGGGVQGLWALNDLRKKGYSVLLLEKGELGGMQTCSSHALIHRGHYYKNIDMSLALNIAAQYWESLVQETGLQKLNRDGAIAGFGPGIDANAYKSHWKLAGLRFKEIEKSSLPYILRNGSLQTAFRTSEFSLDATEIIKSLTLKKGVEHLIYQVDDRRNNPLITRKKNRIHHVDCWVSDTLIRIKPKFLILAAGSGNLSLLDQISSGYTSGMPVQTLRKHHMLVIKGHHLPKITAIFPGDSPSGRALFICSRIAETKETVWLVSDNLITRYMEDEGCTPHPSASWIQRMMTSLRVMVPNMFDLDLSWSVYTALSVERNHGTGAHMNDFFIEKFGVNNLLTMWPTKLTLAPLASYVMLRQITSQLIDPSGDIPFVTLDKIPPKRPRIAAELWTKKPFISDNAVKTDWMSFDDIETQFGPFQ